jgi:hypothetical protein
MKEYLNKSMDELRMEDYQSNRKYVFVNSISGSTKFSSAFGKDNVLNLLLIFIQTIHQYILVFLFICLAPPSTASTTANIFGSNNTPITAASLFSTTRFNTPGGPFNQPLSTAPAPSANPFTTGANIFGPPTSTVVNPFNTATSIAPVATSVSSWTTAQPSPFSKYYIKVILKNNFGLFKLLQRMQMHRHNFNLDRNQIQVQIYFHNRQQQQLSTILLHFL